MNKGILIVLSGPSGVGKGTVLKKVFERDSNLEYSVSCTTRPPRPGETDGKEYHFVSEEKFLQYIDEGKMLESAVYCGNRYGTNEEFVDNYLLLGKDVVLEIETQGAIQVMKKRQDCVSIFIVPPSVDELELRLRGRGTETEDVINARIERALDELSYKNEYKYCVVNDDVDRAANEILSILKFERNK